MTIREKLALFPMIGDITNTILLLCKIETSHRKNVKLLRQAKLRQIQP